MLKRRAILKVLDLKYLANSFAFDKVVLFDETEVPYIVRGGCNMRYRLTYTEGDGQSLAWGVGGAGVEMHELR